MHSFLKSVGVTAKVCFLNRAFICLRLAPFGQFLKKVRKSQVRGPVLPAAWAGVN